MPRLLLRAFVSLSSLIFAAAVIGACSSPYEQTGPVTDCLGTGGICLPAGTCAPGGGTVPAGATNCYSDDGPVECCMGAAPTPGGTSCADQGGICALPRDCTGGRGYQTVDDPDCGGSQSLVCCVPHARCGDPSILCCAQMGGTYPVACDDGTIVCPIGDPQPIALSSCKNY